MGLSNIWWLILPHLNAFLPGLFGKEKIQHILDYGCHVWAGAASDTMLKEIDVIQAKFLKSTAGLPPFTNHKSLLVEFSLPQASLRIQAIKHKMTLKIKLEISPLPVQQAYEKLQSAQLNVTASKHFRATSKIEAVKKREI